MCQVSVGTVTQGHQEESDDGGHFNRAKQVGTGVDDNDASQDLQAPAFVRQSHGVRSGPINWKVSLPVDPLHLGFDVSPESIDQRTLFRSRYSPFTPRTTAKPGR
jgi:hypothetical protein